MILGLEKTIIDFSKGLMVEHIVSKDGVAIDFKKFNKISKLHFSTTKKPFEVFWGWWVIIESSYTCLRLKYVL